MSKRQETMMETPIELGGDYGKKICIWRNYLKDRYPLLLGFVFLSFIFFAVTGLYGYDDSVAKLFYAVILSLFAGCLIAFLTILNIGGNA